MRVNKAARVKCHPYFDDLDLTSIGPNGEVGRRRAENLTAERNEIVQRRVGLQSCTSKQMQATWRRDSFIAG